LHYYFSSTDTATTELFTLSLHDALPILGINSPGLVKEKYYTGVETSDASLESADKIEPYVPENIWPELTYTKDETSVLASKGMRSEEHTSELQSRFDLVCRLLLEKKKNK